MKVIREGVPYLFVGAALLPLLLLLLLTVSFGNGVAAASSTAATTCIPNRHHLPPLRLLYQRTYDLQQGSRDIGYSGKWLPDGSGRFVVTGPSTTPASIGNTGIDFFALMVDGFSGDRTPSFGVDGLVTVDFNNTGGNSRTDVATELVFLQGPTRIALLGEAVVSKAAPSTLAFAVAMLDTEGNRVPSFGTNGTGTALYRVYNDARNDELFFGATDENNNIIMGGFANPGQVSGAGPAFDCAVMKIDQYGNRDLNWAQNGQIIIDFNGWNERCRSLLAIRDNMGRVNDLVVGGRSAPAANNISALTSDQNNFRATIAKIDYNRGGFFKPAFGDNVFGLGRAAVNLNNGSFDTMKIVRTTDGNHAIAVGNWGGWDNGASGNKAIGLVKWRLSDGSLDRSWGGGDGSSGDGGGIAFATPTAMPGHIVGNATGSFDVHSLVIHGARIYVVGGLKATAAIASRPRAMIARFHVSDGRLDDCFGEHGIYTPALPSGASSSLYRSVDIFQRTIAMAGEVAVSGSSTNFDILIATLPGFN